MKQQHGFTLIELVMVIVILGILAATALPRFVDLEGEARGAAVSGVAGALSSAASINYAGCAANQHNAADPNCTLVDSCDDLGAMVDGVAFPADYTLSAGGVAGNGTAVTNCVVTDAADGSATANYTAIGAGQP